MKTRAWTLKIAGCVCAAGALIAQVPVTPSATMFTYGGSGSDFVNAIALDAAGYIYLAGRTSSTDLPGTERGFQKQLRGTDAFVAKFDPTGGLVWATYLGGNDARYSGRFSTAYDEAKAVAVDTAGNVLVAGSTGSTDFPTVNAYQSTPQANRSGAVDGFLAKISRDGSQLLFSTYLGGADQSSSVEELAVTPAGDAWVVVRTQARQFAVDNDLSDAGVGTVLVGRFLAGGSKVSFVRLGFGEDMVGGLAVDRAGQPHVSGYSVRSPCPRGRLTATFCPGWYLTQLDAAGARANFTWALLGSPQGSTAADLAIAPDGTIVMVGSSTGAIETRNAWQPEQGPRADNGFVAILTPQGIASVVSYLAGVQYLKPRVGVDSQGDLHFAFDTSTTQLATHRSLVPNHPDGPVLTSADRGASWNWASRGLGAGVQQFAVDATRNHVYAFNGGAIHRTVDNGESWEVWRTIGGFPSSQGGIALDPRNPTTMYVGSSNLYRLDNDGATVQLLRESTPGVGGFRVGSLAVSPHDGSIWLGTGNGLEVSFDQGRTWTRRDRDFRTTNVGTIDTPEWIVFDRRRTDTVYIYLPFASGVFRSTDNGVSWTEITASLTDASGYPERPFARAFAIDPIDSSRLYVGTFNRGMAITDDGGRTWRRSLPFTAVSAVAVDHVPPYQVYVAMRQYSPFEEGIMISRDRGYTWTLTDVRPRMRGAPTRLMVHPNDPARLYAGSHLVSQAPYLLRLNRTPPSNAYGTVFASYLLSGAIRDAAVSADGDTVLALASADLSNEIAVVRIGR